MLATAQAAGAVTLNVGVFINAVIQFLIVAFGVFWVVRLLNRLYCQPPVQAAPPPEVALLTQIRDLLAEARATTVPGPEVRPDTTPA